MTCLRREKERLREGGREGGREGRGGEGGEGREGRGEKERRVNREDKRRLLGCEMEGGGEEREEFVLTDRQV